MHKAWFYLFTHISPISSGEKKLSNGQCISNECCSKSIVMMYNIKRLMLKLRYMLYETALGVYY